MDQTNNEIILEEKIKKLEKQITLLITLRQNLIDKLTLLAARIVNFEEFLYKILRYLR